MESMANETPILLTNAYPPVRVQILAKKKKSVLFVGMITDW